MPAAHQAGSPGFGGGPRKQGPEVAALRPSCIQLEATSDVSEGQSGDGLGGGAGGGVVPGATPISQKWKLSLKRRS